MAHDCNMVVLWPSALLRLPNGRVTIWCGFSAADGAVSVLWQREAYQPRAVLYATCGDGPRDGMVMDLLNSVVTRALCGRGRCHGRLSGVRAAVCHLARVRTEPARADSRRVAALRRILALSEALVHVDVEHFDDPSSEPNPQHERWIARAAR